MQAQTCSVVRQAAIREDYAKARYSNEQNLRRQLIQKGGVLDQHTLQAALGKRQPRQRMWGVSGQAVLGVAVEMCDREMGQISHDAGCQPGGSNCRKRCTA